MSRRTFPGGNGGKISGSVSIERRADSQLVLGSNHPTHHGSGTHASDKSHFKPLVLKVE